MKEYSLYDGKYKITFHEKLGRKKHVYMLNNGKELLSVTKVMQVLGKPMLVPWAVNCAVDHLVGVLKERPITAEDLERARDEHERIRNEAADTGALVHKWVECHLKGIPFSESLDPKAQRSVDAFLKWEKEKQVKWLESERVIYSESYGYTGRFDALAEIDGKFVLIDFKTSKAVYPDYFAQLGAYWNALGEETQIYTSTKNLVIRFDKETGEFHEHYAENPEADLQAFLACLTLKQHELLFNQTKHES